MSDSLREQAYLIEMQEEMRRRSDDQDVLTDFKRFAREELKVLPKKKKDGLIPFVFNEAQDRIHEIIETQRKDKGHVRVLILKARQQGISTYVAGRTSWLTMTTPNQTSVVISMDGNATEQLFDMTETFFEHMSDKVRPKKGKDNKNEVAFPEINSKYRMYTAGTKNAGRGTTPSILHCSEVGFWDKGEGIISGLFQGIPLEEGTEIILESTANGASGEFYRLWKEAMSGRGNFIPIFLPWFISSEYSDIVPNDFEATPEEQLLSDEFGLTEGQLVFRRNKISETGEDKFKQEYPSTHEEAFLRSGRPVFDQTKLALYHHQKPSRKEKFNAEYRTFEPDEIGGQLELWGNPGWDDKFVIGADVSNGVGQDYCTAVIMTPEHKIVGLFRDNFLSPSAFGEALYSLGIRFNNALLIVERNGPGIASLNMLETLKYSNMYYQTKVAQISRDSTSQMGFATSRTTKPQIISSLGDLIRNEDIHIPSNIILDELQSFVWKDGGKMEAVAGFHDDSVVATALCVEALRTHRHKLTSFVDWNQITRSLPQQQDNQWL